MGLDPNELWQGYLGDSADAFSDIEQSLLALESDPRRQDEINRLYRGLHTLKGNSGFMGLAQIERLAHVTEDLVGLVRDKGVPLDAELCEVLLATHDRLRAVVREASKRQRDVEASRVDDLVATVEAARSSRAAASGPKGAPAPVEVDEPEDLEPMVAAPPAPASEPPLLFAGGLADVPMEEVVPGLDPGYLEVFLSIAQERMGSVSAAAADLVGSADPEAVSAARGAIAEAASDLRTAAERMGFGVIELTLGELEQAAHAVPTDGAAISRLERELYTELVTIEESYQELSGSSSGFGFVALARRSSADHVFASLARLRTLVDAFGRGTTEEAHEIPTLLHDIRVACEHYGFQAAARVCLDHEDRYARTVDEQIPLDDALMQRTREFVERVGAAVDAVNNGEDCEDVPVAAEEAEVPVDPADIARFGLSKELSLTLTREIIARLDGLLDSGERLYEVRAALEEPTLAEAFQAWLRSADATYITSATVYLGAETEFDFLVGSRLAGETIAARIAAIDPSGKVLRLRVAGGAPVAAPAKAAAPKTQPPRVAPAPVTIEPSPRSVQTVATKSKGEPMNDVMIEAPRLSIEKVDAEIAREAAGFGAQQVEYLKIDARKIGLIMDLAGEIGLATGAVTQNAEVKRLELEGFNAASHKLEMLIRELQTEVSSMRLVPVSGVFQRMKRVVRDTAKRTGKLVDLVLRGEDTEIDKFMVDSLNDPLVHLLRNAIDHGLETPEERVAAGKSPTGRILLEATHEAGEVTITVSDDGRGIDKDRVLARGIERGIVEAGARISEQEILDLIFEPGFSTKEVVSELSGRGVGMDVVKTTIEGSLRGRVQVRTSPGKGSRFLLRMPLTLAFIEAMVVSEHGALYVVPIEKVFEVFQVVSQSQLVTSSADGELLVRIRGQLVPVCWVHRFYGDDSSSADAAKDIVGKIVVVIQTALGKLALPVDALLGNQQVMLKPLKGVLSNVRAAAGCGMLRSGDVALALDCERLHA